MGWGARFLASEGPLLRVLALAGVSLGSLSVGGKQRSRERFSFL